MEALPIYVDMTVGDESARITKVKHQSMEETVRILNGVLRKMNAEVKLEIVELPQSEKRGVLINDS
jgi:type III secretory pathway lipoprotein EscJ